MGKKRLEIFLAQNAGFCMGVQRALKLTLDASDDSVSPRPIATIGPLIHNRQVLAALEDKGVTVLPEDAEPDGGTAVIRAHGVSPAELQRLSRGAERVIDATCPHVRKVQDIAHEYCAKGYYCIIVGDAGHAEVEAVLGHAQGRGVIVSSPDQVDDLPQADKVVVVAQTTQDEELFSSVVARVRQRYPQCEVFDTICLSTHRRQAEAKRMAQQVDAMLVVGGFNSANTRRLAQICSETGTPTFHVETHEDLDLDRLLQCNRIGVTAGASTPHWMIRRVLDTVRSEHERRQRSLPYFARLILSVPVRSNIFIGGGAAAVTLANARLMRSGGRMLGMSMALAFFFILAQQLLNQYARRKSLYLNEPERGEFFQSNVGTLRLLAGASTALALFLAALLGWLPFALVAAGTVGGLLYCIPRGKGVLARVHMRRLQNLAGSKELFVGLAWAVTTALVPALAAGGLPALWRGAAIAVAFAFLMAFQRTLLTDLRDVEGDQLVGRETLARVLGERRCKRLLVWLLAGETALLVGGALAGWTSPLGYLLLIPVAYGALCQRLYHRGHLPPSELGEALIDGKFYLIGLLGL